MKWLPFACAALFIATTCPAAERQRPNVLFVICDDLNTQSIGAYGSTVCKTPNIDKLAAAGTKFDRAYCQWPLCWPSRNSFLSGKRPDGRFGRAETFARDLPDVTYLPEHFRRNGYFTARVGKLFHCRTIYREATDYDVARCWDVSEVGGVPIDPCGYGVTFASHPKGLDAHPHLSGIIEDHAALYDKAGGPGADYWMDYAALNVPDEQTVDGNIARRTVELLEQAKAQSPSKPFFIATGFRRPHLLWVAPKKYFDMYPPESIELPTEPADDRADIPKAAFTRGAPDMTDANRRKAIASYYACVSYVDAQLGVVMAGLDKLGLRDTTIVIFTSDHGWHLSQHGLWGKVSLFEESARVPLIISAPGVTKPAASPRPAELLDLYPTLCDLAGLAAPAESKLDGTSLVPQLKDAQAPRDKPAFSVLRRGKIWGRAVYTERHRYTEWGDNGREGVELYDREADPKEFQNLASEAAQAETLNTLKTLLDREIKLKDADAPGGTGD